MPKPGRNAPCPCGSGKKYKKCCQEKYEPAPPALTTAECNELVALFNAGHHAELENRARVLLVRHPDSVLIWNLLGASLRAQSKEALSAFQRVAELLPDSAEARNNLGLIQHESGKFDEAVASYRQALKIRADAAETHFNLGNTLQELGRLHEAAESYRHALKLKPNLIEARLNLTRGGKVTPADDNFAALIAANDAAQSGAGTLSNEDTVFLNFALGKCYDDTGEHEKAFPHFLEGCQRKRATFEYDPEQITQRFGSIMRNFDAAAIDRLRGGGSPSHLPIFILGMPRSGTTLVEQIIASHPEVQGAGELHDLIRMTQNDIGSDIFLNKLHLLDRERLTSLGDQYLANLKRHAPNMQRITDKMPENFFFVGLIHLMLPNAKIIHVQRNPVDTCLSCFTQLFASGQGHFSYNLAELGQYYADYFHLMQHWRKVLPDSVFLDVQYEDIVTSQEEQSRRIIEYCGLEWNNNCLDFHNNKRAIQTASISQVRQPIYRSSVERWKPYEKFLSPLLDALGELAPDRRQEQR